MKSVKSILLLLLLLLPAVPVLAQQKARFHIASFRENLEDLTPKTHEKRDADGNPYAIIKVTSTNPDDDLSAYHFGFEHIPHEVEVKDGELWVYVGRNAMYVNISRDGYHSINHYELNTTIQQGRAYEMKLSAEPKKVLKQMVRFNVSPAQSNAVVMYKSESSGAAEQLFGVAGENGSVAKNLELGRYSYKIISDNYYLSEGLFYLNDVNSVHTENVTLKPNFASIELVAVEGAGILIDGEEKGRGSWKGILKGGKYNVECRKENHKSTFETLEIEAGRDRLVTLASPIPIIGILSLNSMPLDAKITIDGKEHGLTPRNINDLIVGSHKVKISKSGYIDASFDVVIKEGETTEHTVTLQRAAQNSSNNSKVQGSSGSLANAGKTDAGNKGGAERTLDSAKSASNELSTRTFKVKDVEFTMVAVEGGTFSMGSNDGDKDEKPIHQVTLDSYCIGQTEVTQALWQAVMGTTIHDQAKKGTINQYLHGTGDNNPMYYISYNDCIDFVNKLNTLLEDQLPQGSKFRLPTEAEWEYAARGGNKSKGCKYSGSNSISTVAWYYGNSDGKTHPVKQKACNELGLYDMSGNVDEWCSDWYGSNYYSSSPQNNPKGPGSGEYRVLRGGCLLSDELKCRSARRSLSDPGNRYCQFGLRLAF